MIKHFAAQETADLFSGRSSRRISGDTQRRAVAKLLALHAASSLDELRNIPGNRLEKLKGDRSHQYSIRINDQWRVCFRWRNGDAYEVEIVDYHR
jgi:proteic killer suppression protein